VELGGCGLSGLLLEREEPIAESRVRFMVEGTRIRANLKVLRKD